MSTRYVATSPPTNMAVGLCGFAPDLEAAMLPQVAQKALARHDATPVGGVSSRLDNAYRLGREGNARASWRSCIAQVIVRDMRTSAPPLLPIFRSELQGRLLALLYAGPDRGHTISDLA